MNETDSQDNGLAENLSALVDGEVDARESAAIVDQLIDDADLRATWGRYFLIGEAIRSSGPRVPHGELRDRVNREVVGAPPSVAFGLRSVSRRSRVGAAAVALAATIAGVALIAGLDWAQEPANEAPSAPAPIAAAPAPVAPAPVEPVAKLPSWDVQEPAVENRLKVYLVNHSEYIGRGVHGMHPYARVVAYAPAR